MLGDWWWWFPWLLWYPCLAGLPVWWWRRDPPAALPPLPDEEEDEDEEEEEEKKILLRSSLSWASASDSPPWPSGPSSGTILGGPSAYWSTPPVLRGGLWVGPPRPIVKVLLCGGGEEVPLWSSGCSPPFIMLEMDEYPNKDQTVHEASQEDQTNIKQPQFTYLTLSKQQYVFSQRNF